MRSFSPLLLAFVGFVGTPPAARAALPITTPGPGLSTGVGVTPGTGTTLPSQPTSGSWNPIGGGVASPNEEPTPPAVHESLPSTDGSSFYRPGSLPTSNPGTPENQVRTPSFSTPTATYDQGPGLNNFGSGTLSNGFRSTGP